MATIPCLRGPCMCPELHRFLDILEGKPAVLVCVANTQGSTPRRTGAWMAVFADGAVGTIGGGHLEWEAQRQAREYLIRSSGSAGGAWRQRAVLGPQLGQCCGGTLELQYEPVTAADADRLRAELAPRLVPVALFGGGHVGRAIVRALAPLPFEVHWIDSRDGVFASDTPSHVRAEHSEPVQAAVRDLAPGAHVLVMSFSHAEDLDIVAACLQRQRARADLPFLGLIGSRTKWASFRRRLAQRGFTEDELDAVTCPIGLPGITGNEPAVIAASVAAQLLIATGQ
jgi:xanthine dehydrogenase accessory factor